MIEEVTTCPICQGTQFQNSIPCLDHTTSGEMFHVKHCSSCGLGITSPRPVANDAARYYASSQYISHTSSSKGIIDSIYLIVRSLTIKWKLRLVAPFLRDGALLDYGCGTGSFLTAVASKNIQAFGVEPSDARKKINPAIAVVPSLQELTTRTFDVITLWHVLEHVYSLRETLQRLTEMLSPNGAIFLAVPNHESPDAHHYKANWAAYDVPRHLWHFSRQSMATFLQQEGLHIVKVIPMKLDAYYVSMLSEQYAFPKSPGVIRLMRALWVAFRSNLTAKKQINYSSLIFVVQK